MTIGRMDPDGDSVRVGDSVCVRNVIQVSVGGKNCYRGTSALGQKALHDGCGVHPHVDKDAFTAVSGAN